MKKLLSLLLLIPALVFAQSFPSPTYNNLTVNGTSSLATLTASGVTQLSNTSAGASVIKLTGNGVTTPNKYLGVLSGNFNIQNNAQNTNILSLTDAGTLSVTGAVNLSTTGGIVGTTAGDNANAGSDGEFSSVQNAGGTSLTSGSNANCTSIPLAAGDWDVSGTAVLTGSGGASQTNSLGGLSSTSLTLAGLGTYAQLATSGLGSNGVWASPTPVVRFNSATSITVYLVVQSSFAAGSVTATCNLRARRIR